MEKSNAHSKAVTKYIKENYDRLEVRLPKGYKALIQQYTKDNGTNVNAYLTRLIKEDMGALLPIEDDTND